MSVALDVMDEELTGWGLAQAARCKVARPEAVAEIAEVFAEAARAGQTIALRGAGCSYGDAALNANALVLDCSRLNRILAWDAESGQITVEPGVTIAQVWRRTLPDGWWPMVVPGTSAVTVGGAAAMQIHGKNNWHTGAFGESVLTFDLLLPSGQTLTCSRESNSDLFTAAIGGMGLLGAFTALTLQTRRVHSGNVWEVTSVHDSLDALIAALDEATSWATDLVAWIDTSARGKRLGRGLLKMARDLGPDEDAHPEMTRTEAYQTRQKPLATRLPGGWLPRLARPLTSPAGVWLSNRGQWMSGQGVRHRSSHLSSYVGANFPLDAIPDWRESYRPGGLLQHQSMIPAEAASAAFREILDRSQRAGLTPSFAVLKKHRASDALLSCLMDGYSLALDYPVRRGQEAKLRALLGALNDGAAEAGGRVYFAKDSTLAPAQTQRMYGDALERFHTLKRQHDPRGLLTTDLYQRAIAPLFEGMI
ncbi:MAG TPA: FAD-binding oxidoreductase [Ktedonobacterales bacterium]|jgi:FAD/FMN-containing dehydrogenase